MKDDIEFPGIGKNTPYKVPEDFFENISEKTLRKSIQREHSRRKRLFLWRSVAVAASLTAVIAIGYLNLWPGIKPDSKQVVLDKQPAEQQIIQQKQESIKTKTVPEITVAGGNNKEELNDVLPDLSDEELLQLAAAYKTDLFIVESEQ